MIILKNLMTLWESGRHPMSRIRATVLLILLAMPVHAEMWTAQSEVSAFVGMDAEIPYRLVTPNPVQGVSGELLYDPTAFANPQIVAGPMQNGNVVVVGHVIDQGKVVNGVMTSPAKYRFSIFANPFVTFSTAVSVATFGLHIIESESTTKQISFEMETASEPDLDLYSNVEFAPVTVQLNRNAVNNWLLYE
jgi:hypothetical protein